MGSRQEVLRLLGGAMATQVVGVVAEMGLADTISEEGSLAKIAEAHGIPPERALRLLRAFVTLGCCVEREPGVFALTETGSLLCQGDPGSLRDYARLCVSPEVQQPWLRLEGSIRTGRPAFDEVFGAPAFEYMEREPERSVVFNAAMSQGTRAVADLLPGHYDFARHTTAVDVGGGDGTLLAAILRSAPQLRGVLFDLAAGSAESGETLAAAGVSERCEVVAGDFRAAVPAGADLYVIKSVLHNWPDEDAVTILRNCVSAMKPGGTVLIIDPVLPELAQGTVDSYLVDLHMLVVVGGKERTAAEFEELCTQAGLVLTGITALPGTGVSLIQASGR